ncbi:MAG: hypothetical protein V5A57_03115 [Candidatus Paceibacterota bacterium]
MEKVNSISDLITAIKEGSPPLKEHTFLFDLYRTIKEGDTDEEYYEGQGKFENTRLCFIDNEVFTSVAPSVDDLNIEELNKTDGEPILEIKANFIHTYPSTEKKETRTARTYITIEENVVCLGGEKMKEMDEKSVLKALKNISFDGYHARAPR